MLIKDVIYQEQLDFINLHQPDNAKFLFAGVWAEKQMAYELNVKLGSHKELLILNDLKIKYGDLTAQIDHLVLSPYCMYLIETKSCSGTVHVNEFGEWTRNYKSINSPIEQSKRHEQVLIDILNDNLDKFLGKILGFQKRLGCYQRYHYVAISEKGQVKGYRKKFPEVMKYDLIAGKILEDYQRKYDPNPIKRFIATEDEKIRLMNMDELQKFADFLCSINIEENYEEKFRIKATEKEVKPEINNQGFLECYQGACTNCNSLNIQVKNSYGYKVSCLDCGHFEGFKATCPACSEILKLKKVKGEFNISCTCGFSAGYIFGAGELPQQESPPPQTKNCPKCESELVLRTAKKGKNSGNQFWGCSAFPKCRFMKDVES